MDTKNLGMWAWIVGLAVLIVWSLAAAFMNMDAGLTTTVGSLAALLAFLGGIFYLSAGDRTAFFIATAALVAVAAASWTLFGVERILSPIFAGAAAAALAGAAGVLVMVIWEWVTPAPQKKSRKR